MRSIQLVAPRRLEEREVPLPPDPGPGEALVRLGAVGICGSDLHYYLEGRVGRSEAAYPQVLGHEPAGIIEAVGPGVTDLAAGCRVAVEPAIVCGHCEFCSAGHHNNCARVRFMGSPDTAGFFREYALVPAHNAIPIPPGLGLVEAAIVEPLAVILHALELVDIRVGDTVAVLGAGPIGLLSVAVARLAGAGQVIAADRVPHRLRLAGEMGAAVGVDTRSESLVEAVADATRGRGVDVVIDAAGAVETINAGIAVARPGGCFVLIGIPSVLDLPVDLHTAMAKELRLQTVKRSNRNAGAAIELLRAGRVPAALVTHCLPLGETPNAFEMLAAYSDGVGKIVIEMGD